MRNYLSNIRKESGRRFRLDVGKCSPLLRIRLSSWISAIVIGSTLSGCAVLTEGATATNAPPSDLKYAENPVSYVYGSEITPNEPTSARSITKYTISPALPVGLSFDPLTGIISGTPTTITPTANYTIQATNSYGSSFIKLQLAVTDIAPTISLSGSKTFNYIVGTPITTITPTLGGGPTVACKSTPALPAGLSLSGHCLIMGTPTAAAPAATTYIISPINSGGSADLPLLITISDIPPVFSYVPLSFSLVRGRTVTNGTPTNTGGVITSCSSNPPLPAGLTLNANCEILGAGTAIAPSASYAITATNSGGSAIRNVILDVHDVVPVISYTPTNFALTINKALSAVSPTNGGGVIDSCSVLPSLPSGLTLSSSCVITGTPGALTSTTAYTITATNSAGSANSSVNIAVNDVAPTVKYMGSPFTYTHGIAITSPNMVTGGGAIVACTSAPNLPAGLSIDNSTCAITGTPTAAKSQTTYVITATNTGGSGSATISIKVNAIAPNLDYTGSPFSWEKGVTISTTTPNNTGDAPSSCSSSPALPGGISLSPTCVISGAPTTVSAATSYTITGVNSAGSGSKIISITVNDARPAISYTGSPFTYTVNTGITPLTPINTGGAITSCSESPSLPAGLSLSSTCVITGTPIAIAAATNYTITATNAGGTGVATINILVKDVPPTIGFAGSPFTYAKLSAIPTLTPNNSGGAITGCTSSPNLPAGLSLDATTCAISGTPTVVSSAASYTITATNSGGSNGATISITVNDTLPSLTYASAPYTFTKNTAISTETPTNSGGSPTSCSASPSLPAGLSLNGTTCAISGTPTVASASTSYNITASNTAGATSISVFITVNDIAPSINFAGSPFTFTKGTAISTLTPSNSGGTVTSCAASPALPAGLSLSSTCVITGTPTVLASVAVYTITATNSGGTSAPNFSLTVNDAAPSLAYASSPFTFVKNSAIPTQTPTNSGGAIVSCSVAPALPAGLSLHTSTCVITGTPTTTSGATGYVVTATNSGGTSAPAITITVDDASPVISYLNAPFAFTKDVAITNQISSNTGGAITSCAISPILPAGLSFDTTTCLISGTPTAIASIATYTVTATNNAGSGSTSFTLKVNDAAPVIDYIPTSYSFVYTKSTTITTLVPNQSGGTITSCTATPTLPAGLSIVNSNCNISGTPTGVSAATSYTISASNTGGSSTAVITIAVNDVAPAFSYPGSPLTVVSGSAIPTQTPTSTGGTITSCSSSPTLPAGLTISSACVISGTATTATATANYTITATNSGGTATAAISITVNDVSPAIAYAGSPYTYVYNTAISTLTPSNSGATITSCSSSPTLPAGLSLSSSCVISGSPTAVSSATSYTITATNSGGTSNDTISITVKDQPRIAFYSLTNVTPGTFNGAATGSYNIWTGTQDGTARTILTSNTNTLLDSIYPTWNAAGGTIAFSSKRAQNGATNGSTSTSYNTWTMTPTGASPVHLTANTAANLNADGPPVISPNGTQIAYASKAAIDGSNNGTASSSYNIFVMNANGAGTPLSLTKNTNAGLDSTSPAWSPDGTQIVFSSKTDLIGAWNSTANANTNIWVVNSDGTGLAALTSDITAGRDSNNPIISPDGAAVVYSSMALIGATTANSFNIWTMAINGSGKTALTSNTAASLDSANPSWSPDGAQIVFQSKMAISGATAHSYNIWVMDANGLNQVALTSNTVGSTDSEMPSFSPDATKIAFHSRMNVGATVSLSSNIFVINSNGTGSPTSITQNTSSGLDSLLGPQNVWFAP